MIRVQKNKSLSGDSGSPVLGSVDYYEEKAYLDTAKIVCEEVEYDYFAQALAKRKTSDTE